ncbi:MAG: RNA polymerase sigma factor [Nocardiopsaceae bacterium]|nr:RNA polymerase sigma factor [Nocardiopsaceae bacterium]
MEPTLRGRVRDGDPDAFGELFDSHSRAVHRLAYRLTGNRQEAEEVVSLTFLEAWRLRSRVHPDGESLLPWLMGIAVNVARNITRASRRHRAAMARLPGPTAMPDFAEEVAGRLDDAAELACIRFAFSQLRPEEQDVVSLCAWSGLDYAEAARALGIPVGTVRSRLSRARAKLRALAGTPEQAAEPGHDRGQVSSDGLAKAGPSRRAGQPAASPASHVPSSPGGTR